MGKIVSLAAALVLIGAAPGAAFDRAVSFTVENVNRSLVPCPTSGGTVEIRGHLTGPDPLPDAVTVYLHGLAFDERFWRFRAVPGLDFTAELARRGHASLTIDRLGYAQEGELAQGLTASCLGAQADVAHQVIEQLRSGEYSIEEGAAPAFARVALAGHSVGGAVAQLEAYSFGDVDALFVLEWTDLGFSPDVAATFAASTLACLLDPRAYSFMGRTEAEFDHLFFNTKRPLLPMLPIVDSRPTAARDVIAGANRIRREDPCGDKLSVPAAIALSTVGLARIDVPTLLVCGGDDAIFPPPACDVQRLRYLKADDLTVETIPGMGHAATLGFAAGELHDLVSAWLTAHDL